MKKLLSLLAAVMLLSGSMGVGKAQAGTLFDLNLNTLNSAWGYYDDIYSITVEGYGTVNQSFGGDYTFNDGDTFSEYAIFQKVSYKSSLSGTSRGFSDLEDAGKMMFVYAESLSGHAVDVNLPTFNYVFDPGSVISIYVGDILGDLADIDDTYLSAATKIAELNLTVGTGAGKDAFFTGGENTGSTRVTAEMDYLNTKKNVWSIDNLGDLTALSYPTYFVLDTTNSNPNGVVPYGFFDQDHQKFVPQGFTTSVTSTGKVEVFVPEPSTMLLLGAGLLGLASFGRRARKN